MASIKSQLVLHDGMTGTLRSINKALNMTLSSFEAMQRFSGKAINTASISAARTEIGKANANLEQMEKQWQQIHDQQEKSNRSTVTGTKRTNELLNTVKRLASTYLGMQGFKMLTNLSDELTSTKARLSLIVDDGGSVEDLQRRIYASAQSARASYTDTMSTVAKLGLVAGKAFSNNAELVKFTELVNKNFVVGGASSTEQSSAMYQLTQALGSGRLQGDEYRSIIENAPLLAKSIEDYMRNVKKAEGTMKDWASEGMLTADVIKAAVFRSADEVESRFEQMPMTWSQVWASMKNKATVALDPVLQKINSLANNPKVQQAINGIVANLGRMAAVALDVFNAVSTVYNFIADNWGAIGPIIYGIVAALVLYKLAVVAITAVEVLATVAKLAYSAMTGAQIAATTAATAAQYGLNTAIWSCPITWIIALIIVLIVLVAIFYEQILGAMYWLGALFKNIGLWIANVAIAIWNSIKNIGLWFANLGLSIWAIIKNVGLWFANLGLSIWAIIKNVGLWFANLAIGIWNVLKACASNVGIAFNNAWVFIQKGFWQLVNTIMQGLKSLANFANKALGWIGVDIDTSGLDFAAKKIDALNNKSKEYTSIGDAWNEGFHTYDYASVGDAYKTNDYASVSDAWNTNDINWGEDWNSGMGTYDTFQDGWGSNAYEAGAEVGRNLKNSVLNIFNDVFKGFSQDSTKNENDKYGTDYSPALNNIGNDTSSISKSFKSTEEDLKYLRDLAEMEAINRFTTAEVKIDMTGMTNKIDSNMDLDGVLTVLTEGFSEALEMAAEGVHS